MAIFVCQLAAERNFLPVTTRHLISRAPEWRSAFGDLITASNDSYGFIEPRLDEALITRLNEIEAAGVTAERIYLSPGDIKDMHSRGVLVGSHSATHRVLRHLGGEELEAEISTNASFLSGLGIVSHHFALPFGKREHYSTPVVSALARHGYRAVYTTNPRDFSPGDDALHVPRVCVAGQTIEELSFGLIRTLFQKVNL